MAKAKNAKTLRRLFDQPHRLLLATAPIAGFLLSRLLRAYLPSATAERAHRSLKQKPYNLIRCRVARSANQSNRNSATATQAVKKRLDIADIQNFLIDVKNPPIGNRRRAQSFHPIKVLKQWR